MALFGNSKKTTRRKPKQKLLWEKDASIQEEMEEMVTALEMKHVKVDRVFCYRTSGSKAHAYARIWAFPKIFQEVLSLEPAYVLEIISEKFEKLDKKNKKKVIIHELLHIPSNFSGSLLPHKYGHTKIEREVENLFKRYEQNKSSF